MDLSKLPKLSKTPSPANDAVDDGPNGREPEPQPPGEGLFTAMDIFMSVGIGLLFLFLGQSYGKQLFHIGDPYPAVPTPNLVWTSGPKSGQVVPQAEWNEQTKKDYNLAIVGREAQIVGDASLFLFGVAMIVAGLLGVPSHLAFIPLLFRKSTAIVGVLLTSAGLIYALYAIMVMFKAEITPVITMIAVLAGGMTLFMQIAAAQALLRVGGAAGGYPQASSRPSVSTGAGRYAARQSAAGAAPTANTPGRTAHYRFAHQMLRRQVFENPARTVGTLQGPGGRLFLAEMWEAACQDVGLTSQTNPPTGMESEMTQVGPYSAVIVTLPPPQREGEAHFVGIVLRSYVREDGAVIERQPKVLYYALEVAGPVADGSLAALCEWQAGDHVQFADRVPPKFRAFREAMRLKVQARQEVEDRLAK